MGTDEPKRVLNIGDPESPGQVNNLGLREHYHEGDNVFSHYHLFQGHKLRVLAMYAARTASGWGVDVLDSDTGNTEKLRYRPSTCSLGGGDVLECPANSDLVE